MTQEQYLRSRIADIEEILQKRHLPPRYRKNQQHALLYYRMDLERVCPPSDIIRPQKP
ncbi:MAG: hypothetical protein ACI4I5_05190 [Acutalibacteraceae bacterium]